MSTVLKETATLNTMSQFSSYLPVLKTTKWSCTHSLRIQSKLIKNKIKSVSHSRPFEVITSPRGLLQVVDRGLVLVYDTNNLPSVEAIIITHSYPLSLGPKSKRFIFQERFFWCRFFRSGALLCWFIAVLILEVIFQNPCTRVGSPF